MSESLALLLGGTSETAPLAEALAGAGWRTLVSTATDAPLDCGAHARIERRTGPLDHAAMSALIRERGARVIIDAAHPYAAQLHQTAHAVAQGLNIPYLRWARRPTEMSGHAVDWAPDHEGAARLAFSLGRPVLLTTGSRNLVPYMEQARQTGVPLVARVLPLPDSLSACRAAGLPDVQIIAERGPFSVEQNRAHIRAAGAGALVTKDGGEPGGVPAKLEAARLEGCRVIMVRRPEETAEGAFDRIEDLLAALSALR